MLGHLTSFLVLLPGVSWRCAAVRAPTVTTGARARGGNVCVRRASTDQGRCRVSGSGKDIRTISYPAALSCLALLAWAKRGILAKLSNINLKFVVL